MKPKMGRVFSHGDVANRLYYGAVMKHVGTNEGIFSPKLGPQGE